MTQYRTTTDENGNFSLDLPALEKGTYTMKAIFEGDSDAYGSEITKTLIIQGRAYAISIEANNEIIQSGDTTTLTLSFEDEDGDPVIEPGQTIKLYQEYVVSDIILTSDKDILSYSDNDVATLTAKVKTSSGGIPVGVDVVFKKDGVLLDTVQTNTQGIATYSYTSTGAGDITFSAECDLLSETYSITDCIFVDSQEKIGHNYSSNTIINWNDEGYWDVEFSAQSNNYFDIIHTDRVPINKYVPLNAIDGCDIVIEFEYKITPNFRVGLINYVDTGEGWAQYDTSISFQDTRGEWMEFKHIISYPTDITRAWSRIQSFSQNSSYYEESFQIRNLKVYQI